MIDCLFNGAGIQDSSSPCGSMDGKIIGNFTFILKSPFPWIPVNDNGFKGWPKHCDNMCRKFSLLLPFLSCISLKAPKT